MDSAPQSERIHPKASANDDHDTIEVASLTRGMVRGDEAAYRVFHSAYFDRLLRYLLVAAGGNEDRAREALQTAFTRVVRHIRKFDNEKVFWSWLTVLARTALYDQSRGRRRYFAFLERFSHEPPSENLPAPANDDLQLPTLLADILATLPVEDKNLLTWKYTDSRSVHSIAEELQTTEKTVESRLSRLRRKLRDRLLASLKQNESAR